MRPDMKKPASKAGNSKENDMTSLFEVSQKINPAKSGTIEYVLASIVTRAPGGVVQMAPGIAKRILEEANFPEQRDIDSSRVYSHRHAIVSGDWLEGHAITLAMLPDGRMWTVDGQHRLTAISQCDAPVPVTVRIVPVESEKEARLFYAGFDQRKSVRTNRQILDAIGIAKEAGLSRSMTAAVFDASPLLLNNLEPLQASISNKINPEMYLQNSRLEVISKWSKEAKEYEAITKLAKKGLGVKMRGTGVMAVALYTLRHQPSRAKDFWVGMAENDGLRKNDPRGTLINDLLTRSVGTGSVRQKIQQPALAWNAFCEGRDLKIIKCIDGASVTLWGTPLAKGRAA